MDHVLDGDLAVVSSSRVRIFRDSFGSFQSHFKYALPSGDTVEDIFYHAQTEKMLRNSTQCKVFNWVLDLDDPAMRALFHPNDWAQLEKDG